MPCLRHLSGLRSRWLRCRCAPNTLDLTNALVVGVILAAIYTVLRPVMRLILSVLNFCTLGLLYIAVDAWLVWTAAGLVENSVAFDNYWWALAVAVIINVARTLVDAAGGDLKR